MKSILVILLCFMCAVAWGEERFEITYHQLNIPTNIHSAKRMKVIKDKQTGKEFFFYAEGVGEFRQIFDNKSLETRLTELEKNDFSIPDLDTHKKTHRMIWQTIEALDKRFSKLEKKMEDINDHAKKGFYDIDGNYVPSNK